MDESYRIRLDLIAKIRRVCELEREVDRRDAEIAELVIEREELLERVRKLELEERIRRTTCSKSS